MKRKVLFLITLLVCFVCLFVACRNESDHLNSASSDNNTVLQPDVSTVEGNETPTFSISSNIPGCVIDNNRICFDVSEKTDSYSFINAFIIPDCFKWELHWDKSCLPDLNIVSKTVNLEKGDNTLYALFINKGNTDDIYLFEIVVHRKYEVTVSYYYNGISQHSDTVTTHDYYEIEYSLPLDSVRYRFNYWEDESKKQIDSSRLLINGPTNFYANVTTYKTQTITVLSDELSKYFTVENVSLSYAYHNSECSNHPYVDFDVVFTPPSNVLSISNMDVKVVIGGEWAVEEYCSSFCSGYDDEGNYKSNVSNDGWHLRFSSTYIDFEHATIKTISKHFKADTSGNACNMSLLFYNIEISLKGSFQYEILTGSESN